jgi:hypothetical protein
MRRAPLLLLAAALALAGCGGGGKTALSKSEFVAQANAICKDYDARIDALGDPASLEDLVGLAAKAKPIAEDGVAKLRALKAPEELQAGYDEYLATGDVNIELLVQLGEAAKSGDVAAIEKMGTDGEDNADKAHGIAAELGLTECAKDG